MVYIYEHAYSSTMGNKESLHAEPISDMSTWLIESIDTLRKGQGNPIRDLDITNHGYDF